MAREPRVGRLRLLRAGSLPGRVLRAPDVRERADVHRRAELAHDRAVARLRLLLPLHPQRAASLRRDAQDAHVS